MLLKFGALWPESRIPVCGIGRNIAKEMARALSAAGEAEEGQDQRRRLAGAAALPSDSIWGHCLADLWAWVICELG